MRPRPAASHVARETDRGIDLFVNSRGNCRELCALLSLAVGFRCDMAECGDPYEPSGRTFYQVMIDHPRDFWHWHLDHNEQYHATPARAAAHFLAQYREWCEWIAPRTAKEDGR